MGQAKNREVEIQRQAAHWVTIAKLILRQTGKPAGKGYALTISAEEVAALDTEFNKQHEILCQPQPDGSVLVSLLDYAEAQRRMKADMAKQAGFNGAGPHG